MVVSKPSYLTPIAYVENAADAVIAAGTTPGVEGQIFNVIDDPELKQREYFRTIRGLDGCPRRVLYVPVGNLCSCCIGGRLPASASQAASVAYRVPIAAFGAQRALQHRCCTIQSRLGAASGAAPGCRGDSRRSSMKVLFLEASSGQVVGGSLTGMLELIRGLDRSRYAPAWCCTRRSRCGIAAAQGIPVRIFSKRRLPKEHSFKRKAATSVSKGYPGVTPFLRASVRR